jgi:hypothetical protein
MLSTGYTRPDIGIEPYNAARRRRDAFDDGKDRKLSVTSGKTG